MVFCNVFDTARTLVIHAPRANNRLYLLQTQLAVPVCLVAKLDDQAWLWHARYGHLNFRALRELGARNMVKGIPAIKCIEEFCDVCALGKQHRESFPQVAGGRGE